MALSIGRMGGLMATPYVATKPSNYALKNQSQISAAYEESTVKGPSFAGGITGANPVQYPNATVQENQVSHLEAAQKVEKAFQDMAMAFDGQTTAYGSDMSAVSYGGLGRHIDAYV